ncbi:hypothetical protein [Rubritalea tangerina]
MAAQEWARCLSMGKVTGIRVESVGTDGIDVVVEMVQTVTHGSGTTNGTF